MKALIKKECKPEGGSMEHGGKSAMLSGQSGKAILN
ncbi:hypothetical protein Cflav_PD6016 [Pedosphaera parvula Ellin514]|uniref:Uncharacterized protein n=1 Tax=Pedosphaera parvula (strain Ellin514) TaxID=320771 RepID=B9XA40_PEDPL|nr:hypothetical protein Cflav_PD6016 [Pedosphaera parvula Ellin514]